jgi:hypothetical protein
MQKRFYSIALAAITALALAPAAGSGSAQPLAACRAFEETGKQLCGRFLAYWQDHGGLPQQGYPISNEFTEVSDVDGKPYTVQYFERAVFEYHPENQPQYQVLLSLLGSLALRERYPAGPPPPAFDRPTTGQTFPETGFTVSGRFLEYWQQNGGLAQQGFPITEEIREVSPLNGKEYIVQYFERAVFEHHPENQPPYDVLLSQLGTLRFKAKYPAGEPPGDRNTPTPLPALGTPVPGGTALAQGAWGGQSVQMEVRADGAHLEFDCAHADIKQALATRADGSFEWTGTYLQEHGGPVAVDEGQARPARFTGTVSNGTMTLTITYTDDNTKIGQWTLQQGNPGRIMKCM